MNLYIMPVGRDVNTGMFNEAFGRISAKMVETTFNGVHCYLLLAQNAIGNDWVKQYLGTAAGGTGITGSALGLIPVSVSQIGSYLGAFDTTGQNFLKQNISNLQSVAA